MGTYRIHQADMFIDLGRPGKALDYLDDAERLVHPSKRRLRVLIDIFRARCYMEQKHPEYEQAVFLLQDAITANRELRIARNIQHIESLYSKLENSSYGNSPDVVELGLALRSL